MSCEFAHDDAAYVLGALAPADRLAFERHLPGCDSCSRAVQELAGLTGLLARVSPDVLDEARDTDDEGAPVTGPPAVPPTVLPALVREVRRHERRRRWLTVGVAAASVVLVSSGAIALTRGDGDGAPVAEPTQSTPTEPTGAATGPTTPTTPASPPTAPAEPMRPVGDTDMTAQVSLTTVPWGTRLDLVCTYPVHLDKNGRDRGYGAMPNRGGGGSATYSLVVRTRDGRSEQVATWHVLPGKTMNLTAATATAVGQIAAVQVRVADGRPLLQLRG